MKSAVQKLQWTVASTQNVSMQKVQNHMFRQDLLLPPSTNCWVSDLCSPLPPWPLSNASVCLVLSFRDYNLGGYTIWHHRWRWFLIGVYVSDMMRGCGSRCMCRCWLVGSWNWSAWSLDSKGLMCCKVPTGAAKLLACRTRPRDQGHVRKQTCRLSATTAQE